MKNIFAKKKLNKMNSNRGSSSNEPVFHHSVSEVVDAKDIPLSSSHPRNLLSNRLKQQSTMPVNASQKFRSPRIEVPDLEAEEDFNVDDDFDAPDKDDGNDIHMKIHKS